MTIDPHGTVPTYKQIAAIIARRIRDGELLPRHPIPSEAQMVQEWGVARSTARHAVEYLRDQGLVYTVQGRGTFVGPRDTEPTG